MPIWEGFAKRGLGYSANAGSSAATNDGAQAFDLPPSCMIDVQPPTLNVCTPTSATFDVALGESFQEAATLSTNGIPAGTNASFTVNPLSSPTHSTLTIANTGSALPGSYTFAVVGTGSSKV